MVCHTFIMKKISSISSDILKIQKKLATFEVGSRNHKKYIKILTKHIKNNNMSNRLKSNIKSVENIDKLNSNLI